jgi:hypothetical protein
MRFCQKHWGALRQAIQARGLGDFVAGSGEEALSMTVRELSDGPARTKAQFDPLMSAHNMITHNAMSLMHTIGVNPLSLFFSDPEHPEMECPICCLNWHSLNHDRICTTPNCPKPIGIQYDDWIEKAAQGAADYLKTLE